jgi:oligo-1,6-glucosidase
MTDFGSMADFDLLLTEMHKRNLRLIMDIVVNHSSDQHEWFLQSKSSRDNPYRNYYHWWPAEKGKPNYRYSLFDEKGDAWKYDSLTDAYYLHYFSANQPDLNWENPKVRQEVYEIMKFWAEKGVDGFRLDAFQFAAKDTAFPAIADDLEKNFVQYYAMQGNLHMYLQEMNAEVFSKYDVMSVAEGAGRNFEDAHNLVDEDRNEIDMAYAFEGVDIAQYGGYDLVKMKTVFSTWDAEFSQKGWLSIFLANHDQARMVSRWASDKPAFRAASAKMLNTFILTMRGTPYCYYGDELGMTNIYMDSIDQYQDIAAINSYQKALAQEEDMTLFMEKLKFSSRDNGRTPMQWDATQNAGFSTGKPWLPVNENYLSINVKKQQEDANSSLNYFRALTKLRMENPALIYGDYALIAPDHPTVYAYTRSLGDEKWLILLNFSENESSLNIELETPDEPLLNNYTSLGKSGKQITLLPYQSVVYKI